MILAEDTAFALFNKLENMTHFGNNDVPFFDFADGFGDIVGRLIDQLVSMFESLNRFCGKPSPAQADDIQAGVAQWFITGDNIRGYIFGDPEVTADQAMASDFDELMNADHTTQDRKIFNLDMSGQIDRIGHDDIVSEQAIVGDVAVGHQEAIASDDCFPVRLGAAVDRDKFADHGALADFGGCRFTAKFEVLGYFADNAVMQNGAIGSQTGAGQQGHKTADVAMVTDNHIIGNPAIWTNGDIFADLSVRIKKRCGMNSGHR